MRSLKFVTILALFVLCASLSQARSQPQKRSPKSKLSTDVNFNGRLVKGQYQYSTESITTVENEKGIDDLIGVRKDFNDRIQKSRTLR